MPSHQTVSYRYYSEKDFKQAPAGCAAAESDFLHLELARGLPGKL